MSKTITISDETYEALRSQIDETEEMDKYPIAAISLKGGARLILNLPDELLAKSLKGKIFSVRANGNFASSRPKGSTALGDVYQYSRDETQVFPPTV